MNIQQTYTRIHGIDFPKGTPEAIANLIIWQRHKEPAFAHANFLNPVSEHFLRACRLLFTPQQLVIHPWFEAMSHAWTYYNGIILMGAASSGKSHFLGIAALLDYLADPGRVYCSMVSTDKGTLLLRSLASSIEYLSYLRSSTKYHMPFKWVAQKSSIVPEGVADSEVHTQKSIIKGVAIADGNEMDAKSAVIGVHLPRVRSIADELENMGSRAQVFLDAQDNLVAGTDDYKLAIAFNPQSREAPGCKIAEPKGGWGTVSLDTDEWVTALGYKVLRFDGHKSPGRKDPKKYPFLPSDASNQKILDRNHGNEDSPGYWAFVRAFPPSTLGARTVLTREMVDAWKMKDPVVWEGTPFRVAALDPAFTSDGDDCVLGYADVGLLIPENRWVICFGEPRYLKIDSASSQVVLQQIGDQAVEILREWGITSGMYLACDDSGTQSVADYLSLRGYPGLLRFNYQKRPPEVPVSSLASDDASTRYRNTVTWMYYTVRDYGQYGQLRGLSDKAAQEFCGRRLSDKLKGLLELESKKEFKKRNKDGRSPDTADMMAQIVGLVRLRLGLLPGAKDWLPPMTGFYTKSVDNFLEINNISLISNAGRYTTGG